MKRRSLINILWVCYLFIPNTECKWLLTEPDSASGLGFCDCAELFMWIVICSFNSLLSPKSSFFSSPFFSLSVCEHKQYSGVRLHPQGFSSRTCIHTHSSRWQVFLFHTHRQWLALSFPASLEGPRADECVIRSNGSFYKKVFTECGAQGNTCFTCDCLLFSPVCCQTGFYQVYRYRFISPDEWYITPSSPPRRLVRAGCIICDKYWRILSWGINFEWGG